jgi:Rrf2 family protein
MKLQKNTQLALYSVLEFAARPLEVVPAAEVADKYGESAHHLSKVLSELTRAGIVESVRGVGGGYRFVANERRLSLLDVIRVFEQPGAQGDAAATSAIPAERALAQVLAEIDQTTIATFGSITIATMLKMVAQARHHQGA